MTTLSSFGNVEYGGDFSQNHLVTTLSSDNAKKKAKSRANANNLNNITNTVVTSAALEVGDLTDTTPTGNYNWAAEIGVKNIQCSANRAAKGAPWNYTINNYNGMNIQGYNITKKGTVVGSRVTHVDEY